MYFLNVSVCTGKTSTCLIHVDVFPVHTGAFRMYTRRVFQPDTPHTSTPPHPPHTTHTPHTHTPHPRHPPQTPHTTPHNTRRRQHNDTTTTTQVHSKSLPLELHITKFNAAYYKHNPLITYKMGLFSNPNFVMHYCVSCFDH